MKYQVYQLQHEHKWGRWDEDKQKWVEVTENDGWVVATEPGHTTEGVETRTCIYDHCNHHQETRTVEPTGHDWQFKETVPPTCTSQGYDVYECANGDGAVEYRNYTPMVAHTEDSGEITTEPTCTQPGVRTYTCTVCSRVIRTEAVPALDHEWGEWISDAGGATATRTCSRCGKTETKTLVEYIPGTTIPLVKYEDVWPQIPNSVEWSKEYTVQPSGAFKYNGNYYVIYNEHKNNAASFRNTGVEGIWNQGGWGFVVKLDTSNIYTEQSFGTYRNGLQTSTLYKADDGTYYVYTNSGWNQSGPPTDSGYSRNWYKIPGTGPDATTNSVQRAVKKAMRAAALQEEPVDEQEESQEQDGPAQPTVVTNKNLTEAQLLSDLSLAGLGIKNEATGNTLVRFEAERTLTTKDEPGEGEPEPTTREVGGKTVSVWSTEIPVPLKSGDRIEYTYYVVETDPAVGGEYITTYAGQDTGLENNGVVTITNQKKPADIDVTILKVDAETNKPLTGAKFQLTRSDSLTGTPEVFENDMFDVDAANENKKTGPFTITSEDGLTLTLRPGYYTLTELSAPDGYIVSTKAWSFEIANDGTVTGTEVSSITDNQTDETVITVTIPNTPGVGLPNAGGVGTTGIYLLGAALSLAGAALARRSRKA